MLQRHWSIQVTRRPQTLTRVQVVSLPCDTQVLSGSHGEMSGENGEHIYLMYVVGAGRIKQHSAT